MSDVPDEIQLATGDKRCQGASSDIIGAVVVGKVQAIDVGIGLQRVLLITSNLRRVIDVVAGDRDKVRVPMNGNAIKASVGLIVALNDRVTDEDTARSPGPASIDQDSIVGVVPDQGSLDVYISPSLDVNASSASRTCRPWIDQGISDDCRIQCRVKQEAVRRG